MYKGSGLTGWKIAVEGLPGYDRMDSDMFYLDICKFDYNNCDLLN
jgi:hypothetical protein